MRHCKLISQFSGGQNKVSNVILKYIAEEHGQEDQAGKMNSL
jgi:hypothetical protein